MKTFKISILALLFSLVSFTIADAADFDCGCSELTPAGSASWGYNSAGGDCCDQVGFALAETYNDEGELTSSSVTSMDVSGQCDDVYGC